MVKGSPIIRISKSQYLVDLIWQTFLTYNSLVRLAERSKSHGSLPLADVITSTRLSSNHSTYWPIDALKKNRRDFTTDPSGLYATTPPQVIRTTPVSHELHLARQNQLHRWVSPWRQGHVDNALCRDFQHIRCFYCPETRVRFYGCR